MKNAFAFGIAAIFLASAAYAGACGGSDNRHAKSNWSQKPDIVQTAVDAGSFNTLAAALQAAGLVDALKETGPYTVFAPTDEAFAKLPAGTVESLLQPKNRDKLVAILTYHVVPGKVPAKKAAGLDTAPTLNGRSLDIQANRKGVRVDNANVIQTDIMASNGVIHVIDSVLIPAELASR